MEKSVEEILQKYNETFIHKDKVAQEMEDYANSKIPKWIPGKPDVEHTCLMMVKVYNHDKFLFDEYIVGMIDETGSIVFMNDDSTGWEEDAIECWMEIPKGASDIEDIMPKIKK